MRILGSYAYLAFLALSTAVIGLVCLPLIANPPTARGVAKLWARSNLLAVKYLCGLRAEIRGREHMGEGPAIIAAKHQSMWETLKLYDELPHACFVLKKELRSIPMFGWWCQAVGFIFVDRDAGAKALRSMLVDAKKAIEGGASHIVIFPEGTRVKPGEHVPYQPGVAALAKSLKVPVIPTAHNSGSYWVTPGPMKIPGTVILEFLPALPVGLSREDISSQLEPAIEETVARLETEARQALRNKTTTQGAAAHG